MYHSTSGKNGFRPYVINTDFFIEKSLLRNILLREDELRASEEFQEEYTKSDSLPWLRDVTAKIQERALSEHGITDPRGLIALRNARYQYKHDPTMNTLTVYMRHDRSTSGTLGFGDEAPNANLCGLDGNPITLFEFIDNLTPLPLVMFVGSVS